MTKKITWQDIYKEFRARHPNLRKDILDWRPHGYLTIVVKFRDGSTMIYDSLCKRGTFVKDQ